jgi:hypothetical protein
MLESRVMSIKGSFDTLWAAYPAGFHHDHAVAGDQESERIEHLGKALKKKIGGGVDNDSFVNLCVIRLSYAMNRAGLLIPGKQVLKWYAHDAVGNPHLYAVVRGGDGLYYGRSVAETYHYLTEKYGKPDLEFAGPFQADANGGISPPGLKGKQGILIFFVKGWGDANGHATLWNGRAVADNEYFRLAHKVALWEVTPKPVHGVRIPNLNDSIRVVARPVP